MKKKAKKIYSILLIILMLANYMPIVSRAVEDSVMTLALESTASRYDVTNEILVDLKVSQINGIGAIKQFAANIEYDNTTLELIDIILNNAEYTNNSVVSESRILITKSSGDGTIDVGDNICTLKFKALKTSDTKTTVKVVNIDATCNSGSAYHVIEGGIEDIDGYVSFPEITLPVENIVMPHNLKITKTDTANTIISNNSALFKIVDLSGKAIYGETAEDGTLTFTNLQMPTVEGPYTYTIQEIVAPTGYVINKSATTIQVTFAEDGTVNTAVATNATATINADTNTIEVSIKNEAEEVKPEPEVFNIVLNKVDEENQNITTDTTEFQLTLPDRSILSYATNAGTGKTDNIAVIAPESAGVYTYLIKETKAPSGYITEPNNIIVELTFEEQANKIVLVSANIVSYNNESVTPTVEGETKTLNLNIKNEKEIITYNYSINIDKVKNDTFKTKITEDTAIFEITEGDKTYYAKTNILGRATFDFSITNKEIEEQAERIYTIREAKAPKGYVLDKTSKTVTLTFNADGSINQMNVEGTNIEELSSTTNTANVQIINEEEQQETVLVPENFNLLINKVDELGNLITADSANFILTKPNGEKQNIETTNGVAPQIGLTAPTSAGKQIYVLKETKAPQGYEILTETIVLEMNYIESEGKVVLENAVVNSEAITPTTVSGTKTLTLNIKNSKVQEQKNCIINVNLSSQNNQAITEGETVLKFTNQGNNEYFYKELPVTNGAVELEMPNTVGNVVYEIEEIKSPKGYEANKDTITLTLTFGEDENGEIALETYTVEGNNAQKDETAQENVASLTIINTPVNVGDYKENYSIEINKVDSKTSELIQKSAVFTLITEDSIEKDYATTSGKTVIGNLVPDGTEKLYVIKEKTAPEGYDKLKENIVIKVKFGQVEGKIVANSAELVLGSDNTQVTLEGNVVKVTIKNEKLNDLYVISKKDQNQTDIYDVLQSYTGRHYSINSPFIDTRIAKLGGNVTVQAFINNLESNGILTVWDKNGNQVPSGNRVKTNMILKANKDDQEMTFAIVVKGDIDGDGRVRTRDAETLEKHLAKEEGKIITDVISLRAADIGIETGDGIDGIIRTTDINNLYNVLAKGL